MNTENRYRIRANTFWHTSDSEEGEGGVIDSIHGQRWLSALSMQNRWMPHWSGGNTSPNHNSFSRSFAFILSLTTVKLLIEPNELTRFAVGREAGEKEKHSINLRRTGKSNLMGKREVRATCSSHPVSNCKWNEFCMTDDYYVYVFAKSYLLYYCLVESNDGSIIHANATEMLLFPVVGVHLHDGATFRRCLSTSRISMRTFFSFFYSIWDTQYAFTMQKRQV